MEESQLEILTERRSQMFYKSMNVHSDICYRIEYFFNKHVKYSESVKHEFTWKEANFFLMKWLDFALT